MGLYAADIRQRAAAEFVYKATERAGLDGRVLDIGSCENGAYVIIRGRIPKGFPERTPDQMPIRLIRS